MTVTYSIPKQIDAFAWRLAFTSSETAPVSFRAYLEGRLIDEQVSPDAAGEVTLMVEPGTFPFAEVLDLAAQIPSVAFAGRLTLNWLPVTGASYYRVEESISAVWTLRSQIDDRGNTAFQFESRWLEDVTSHSFRVLAVDEAGNSGSVLGFTVEMVRHPNSPLVEYSYGGAGDPRVTVTAA